MRVVNKHISESESESESEADTLVSYMALLFTSIL